jgi:OOP family OmpA-OmpF porin
MINSKLIRAIGIGLSLYGATLSVAAADETSGWYFGASGGQSQVDVDQDELDSGVVGIFEDEGAIVLSGSSELEDSDTAWSLFGGYRLSPYFAVEAGYQDLGTIAYRSSGTVAIPGVPGTFPASVNIDFESSGFTLAGVGSIPIGESFDLHGRLGVFFADTEVGVGVSLADFSDGGSESASSQDLFYGVGAALHFGGNWSISLDYQMFKDVGDDEVTGEEDADVVSLAVSYRL